MDKVTATQEERRRAYEEEMRAQAHVARLASIEEEDPTLAAYNDHLASLGTQPKKRLWGH
jgi:DNA/RNA-binding domain of Phe-tRNA-synthetase-like protein